MAAGGQQFHGGSGLDALARSHPDAPRPWIDLSTGINPFPYPVGGLDPAVWTALPSPSAEAACRAAIAACLGADAGRIALLPGSQAGISLLPALFPPAGVDVVEPTYNEHAAAWRRAGHAVVAIPAAEAHGSQADILVLTNPNNPDGAAMTAAEVVAMARVRTAADRWLVVDEAFADLEPALSAAGAGDGLNLVVLRSFGKFFGLAGLRLGAAVGPHAVTDLLSGAIGPWAVSGPALAIGARAYADLAWQQVTRERLSAHMSRLRLALAPVADIVGGTALFVLVSCPGAAALFDILAKGGFYVRRFRRNPRWLRFGLPPDEASFARLETLLAAWGER
jgi:cobalamin biosynthetic protein CobC